MIVCGPRVVVARVISWNHMHKLNECRGHSSMWLQRQCSPISFIYSFFNERNYVEAETRKLCFNLLYRNCGSTKPSLWTDIWTLHNDGLRLHDNGFVELQRRFCGATTMVYGQKLGGFFPVAYLGVEPSTLALRLLSEGLARLKSLNPTTSLPIGLRISTVLESRDWNIYGRHNGPSPNMPSYMGWWSVPVTWFKPN